MRLIDGDALMKRLGIAYDCRECDQDKSPYCTWKPDVVNVCQIIADAPTIEERKKGKWIKEDQYINRWGDTVEILRCPICEFKHNYTQGDTSHSDDGWFDFCPYCGSDMREGDQDDSE